MHDKNGNDIVHPSRRRSVQENLEKGSALGSEQPAGMYGHFTELCVVVVRLALPPYSRKKERSNFTLGDHFLQVQ